MTNRIHQLDPQLANQIAAGEVVERPANVVKELVENALDANARRVTIDIEDGGKKLIRVRDDGSGMNASDALLALQRHATSKLSTVDDLFSIRTLGFRGEALPSIASVSRLELTTQEAQAPSGTKLIVDAGVVREQTEVGATPGTEIAVHNLFFNTPARFKFLRGDSAEAGRISELVGHLALAYPEVAFRLRHNGGETLRSEVGGNGFNAVVSVLGRDTARQMLPIAPSSEGATSEIQVAGFVGRPQLTRSNRNNQIFYVNGRVIRDRALQHAIQAAYEGLLHGHGRHPVAVVFISLPPNAVDVNVHPAKSEVRFAREWEVHHAVRIAVQETLVGDQLTPDWGFDGPTTARSLSRPLPPAPDVLSTPELSANPPLPLVSSSHSGAASLTAAVSSAVPTTAPPAQVFQSSVPLPSQQVNQDDRSPVVAVATEEDNPHQGDQVNAAPVQEEGQEEGVGQSDPDVLSPSAPRQAALPELATAPQPKLTLRPIAQISHNAYILCEAPDGIYIVSQHRAHERILADQALEAVERQSVASQRLIIPFTVEAGARAVAAVEDHIDVLSSLGFEVEAFGGQSLLVRAVPSLVAEKDYEVAFTDVIEELVEGGRGDSLHDRRRTLLTMLACKNAIKAGYPLPRAQMESLIADLLRVQNPSICPHGQPILIRLSTQELDKKFEREYAARRTQRE